MKEHEAQFRQAKATVKSIAEGSLRWHKKTHSEDVKLEQRVDPVTKFGKAGPWE
jgi:hypothetical protein